MKMVYQVTRWHKTIRALTKTILFKNDISRWERVEKETHKWDKRNKIIASYIPKGSSVLDVGAGAQTLRNYLSENKYVPCDVVPHPGTIYCDLNKNIYPSVNEKFDYVVCSGVMEYLLNPEETIIKLSAFGEKMIVSYAAIRSDERKLFRLISGWKNHLTEEQLEGIFIKADLTWEILGHWDNQIIYILNRS